MKKLYAAVIAIASNGGFTLTHRADEGARKSLAAFGDEITLIHAIADDVRSDLCVSATGVIDSSDGRPEEIEVRELASGGFILRVGDGKHVFLHQNSETHAFTNADDMVKGLAAILGATVEYPPCCAEPAPEPVEARPDAANTIALAGWNWAISKGGNAEFGNLITRPIGPVAAALKAQIELGVLHFTTDQLIDRMRAYDRACDLAL